MKKNLLLFLIVICVFVLSGCGISVFLGEFTSNVNSEFDSNLNAEINKNPGVTDLTAPDNHISFENDKTCYSRNNFLNKDEKLVYDVIYREMKEYKTSVSLASLKGYFASEEEMKNIFSNAVFSVLRDHPELFMYNNSYAYTYDTDFKVDSVLLKFELTMDLKTAKEKQQHIDTIVNGIKEKIKNFDDYSKSKYVYTYLAQNITYGDSENMYNMCGALLDGKTKCDGYTKAYLYIMQKCGVEAGYICGEGKGEPHAWNIVNLNGDWYYVDCTWGDPIVESENAEELKNNVDYSYLHLTTAEILKSHTLDKMFAELPEYKETKENYYIKEAFFFEKYDEEVIRDILYSEMKKASKANNKVKLEIKYQNDEDAEKAYNWINTDNIMSVAGKIDCSGFSYRKTQSDIGTLSVKIDIIF